MEQLTGARRLRNHGALLILQVQYKWFDASYIFIGLGDWKFEWRDATSKDLTVHSSAHNLLMVSAEKKLGQPGLTGHFRYDLREEGLVLQVEEYKPWAPSESSRTDCRSPGTKPSVKPRFGYKEFQWRNAALEDLTVHNNCNLEVVS